MSFGLCYTVGKVRQGGFDALEVLGGVEVSLGQVVEQPLDCRCQRVACGDIIVASDGEVEEREKLEAAFQDFIDCWMRSLAIESLHGFERVQLTSVLFLVPCLGPDFVQLLDP